MMNSPLAILRDLFPFTQPATEQNSMAVAKGWLASLASLSAYEAAHRLSVQLIPQIVTEANLHTRFKLLEEALKAAEISLPMLEYSVMQAALPLPAEVGTAATAADNLLKTLAEAYANVAREIRQSHLPELGNLYHQSTLRAITQLARRQFLAYRAYAAPSAASWQMLHELYLMACNPGATSLTGDTAVIEHEYLGALLLAYMEPGKLPRTELETIHACTHQLAAYAVVGEMSAGAYGGAIESCFIVTPGDGNPGYPTTRIPAGAKWVDSLIIDCSQVVAALDRNLSRSLGRPIQPDLKASPTLLQSLRIVIAGKSARRFSRTQFRPHADLIGGFAAVISFLNGNAWSRRSVDQIGRHESHPFSSSEWSLVDEGPDGFRIRFIQGEKTKLGVGDLVALQPRESSKTHICLVRRVATAASRLELGLQLLSPQVSVVNVSTGQSAPTRAIFLHSLPAYGMVSGLIAPPEKLITGQTITFNVQGKTLHLQIGKCMEANEGLEFVVLDPLPD